jgi:tRNA uridine 5-carboxymethylaminomethyl modification enzyme
LTVTPNTAARHGLKITRDGVRRSALDLLAYNSITFEDLKRLWREELSKISPKVQEQLEIDAHYSSYMERQRADIAAFRKDESLIVPQNLDFSGIPGLSTEQVERFERARPETLGAAARIAGTTPAALTALLGYVKKTGLRKNA